MGEDINGGLRERGMEVWEGRYPAVEGVQMRLLECHTFVANFFSFHHRGNLELILVFCPRFLGRVGRRGVRISDRPLEVGES